MKLPARVAAALLALVVVLPVPSSAGTGCDALCHRVRSELRVFTRWLDRHDVKGYIGEVGWPDGPDARRWNRLARRWYKLANRSGLHVTTWATGEWWGTTYPLAVYEDTDGTGGVDTPNSQAPLVEGFPSVPGRQRGVSVAGAEFAGPVMEPTSSFSNVEAGAPEVAYHYDSRATFDYLASRGVRLVRIPFRWERIQPELSRQLDRAELRRLRRAVRRANEAGLRVVLDMHNYGAYYRFDGTQGVRRPLGSKHLRPRHFVNVWRRLSRNFEGRVWAYGLMNEPVGMTKGPYASPAEKWERISARTVRAIRQRGDRTRIAVSGYFWSGAQRWTDVHPEPWIRHRRVIYEAHHYWDRDNSGDYPDSYAAEVADARARGYG